MKSCSTLKNSITSIAIGGFDGMHRAHQELFKKLGNNGAIVVIETGYANLSPYRYREFYTSLPIFYYPLDEIKHLHADEFLNLLNRSYPALEKIIVGYDFHFGANAKYSAIDLKELFDGEVMVIDEIKYKGISVHSGVIREFIQDGQIEIANELLSKPYMIAGNVISGQGLGQKQFVPTINLNVDKFLLPKDGIYATKTTINNTKYNSVSFLGHRVTTDGQFAVETHIIDQDIEHKSDEIFIEFYSKIRDNKKYESFNDLKKQILLDIQNTKEYFDNRLINKK